MEDDPYFDKKPSDDGGGGGDSSVQVILASIRDEGTPVDAPDGSIWKVDPKRTSFVEVGTLRDQRSSMAISLLSSTASSQYLKQDEDEITVSGGDTSRPSSKHSDTTIFVSNFSFYFQQKQVGT